MAKHVDETRAVDQPTYIINCKYPGKQHKK